ncbi:MAG: ABC transporter ATP-binding protein [Dehalococcoidia bacterium]|nr:ABC transporter ATP-binding protein [Thermoflexaceae bacterium]
MSIDFSAQLHLGRFDYDATFTAQREILVLFGHSGAGKSVTLQAIAGLIRPQAGHIDVDGVTVFDSSKGLDLPPQRRNVGYVVQDLALFPHMSVAENVAFGVARGVDRQMRTAELLGLLGLQGFEHRMPRTLSGGQQQRVALARALARDARVLLLDEPFSALDDSLRSSLRRELLRLRAELGLTIVFVTHDLREAHLLAERIAVFDAGRILQLAAREVIFRAPASRRVAELTGVANVFTGSVRTAGLDCLSVEVSGLALDCAHPPGGHSFSLGMPVEVAIRAERAILRRGLVPGDSAGNVFEAVITEEFAYGSSHTLRLQPIGPGPAVEVEIATRPYEVLGIASQKRWLVELPPEDLHVMPIAAPQ